MVSDALLSFSLTPVQGFIEASRSLRDLTSGSALLSHLTLVAITKASTAGGTLIFPSQPPSAKDTSLPNIFLARFVDRATACAAETECRDAVQTRWEEVAKVVHVELNSRLPAGWDVGWDDQITRFWDIQTVVLEAAHVPAVLREMSGCASGPTSLGQQFRAMQALLASAKLVRRFPGDNGVGRHKCALMGEWEQMGPTGLRDANEFWGTALAMPHIHGVRLTRRDRLCAPALVKRFCLVSPHLSAVAGCVPDTAAVATEVWWKAATAEAPTAAEGFVAAVGALQAKLGDTADTVRRYLLDDDLTAGSVASETGFTETEIAAEVASVKDALRSLREVPKVRQLGDPPRYYAILVQDGDEIGQWLNGQKTAVDEHFYKSMSSALQDYASQVRRIVENHHGYLVYAGGDDALALLPLSRALSCAQELRRRYPCFAPDGCENSPTLSTGIAIVHHKYDLRAALSAARTAERQAKDEGRDALGIALVKRAGGPTELTLPWALVPKLEDLRKLFAAGVSDGWLSRLDDLCSHLRNWYRGRGPVALLIGQVTRGLHLSDEEKIAVAALFACTSPDDATSKAREHIKGLWDLLWDSTCPGPGVPSNDCEEFLRQVLGRFMSVNLVASFLNRGRD